MLTPLLVYSALQESIPNWSQLRSTPINFRPSRRATISFSVTSVSVVRCETGASRVEVRTVGQIEKLCGCCKHLCRKLLRRWRGPAKDWRTRRTGRAWGRGSASLARRRIIDRQVLHYLMWNALILERSKGRAASPSRSRENER